MAIIKTKQNWAFSRRRWGLRVQIWGELKLLHQDKDSQTSLVTSSRSGEGHLCLRGRFLWDLDVIEAEDPCSWLRCYSYFQEHSSSYETWDLDWFGWQEERETSCFFVCVVSLYVLVWERFFWIGFGFGLWDRVFLCPGTHSVDQLKMLVHYQLN